MTEKITVSKAWVLMAAQSIIEGADGSDLRYVLDEEDIKILIEAQKVARKTETIFLRSSYRWARLDGGLPSTAGSLQ